jgi:hypothetical protein
MPSDQSQRDNGDERSREHLVPLVLGVTGFMAGAAALLANIDSVTSNLLNKCIELNLCSPGQHFVSARIRLLSPSDPTTSKLLSLGEDVNPADYLSDFAASVNKQLDFEGIEYAPVNGVSNEGEVDGLPLQTALETGFWDATIGIGWRIAFPIFDVLIGEKEPLNITDINVDVLKTKRDTLPYLQMVTPSDLVGGVLLLNESVHDSVEFHLEYSVLPQGWQNRVSDKPKMSANDICKYMLQTGAIQMSNLKFKTNSMTVNDQINVDFSPALKAEIPDFKFREYRNKLAEIKNGGSKIDPKLAPSGYIEWERKNPLSFTSDRADTALAYGKLISEANSEVLTSAFCAFVPIDPPEGLGGAGEPLKKAKMIKLGLQDKPYTIDIDRFIRLDTGKPYFRAGFFFASDTSGIFDLKLQLKSFNTIVYESNLMRLHLFVPRTTVEQMKLPIDGAEIIPQE